MASLDAELQQAVALLRPEFPDISSAVIEAALREADLDIPTARRKLLQVKPEDQRAQGPATTGPTASVSSPTADDGAWSWSSWNQSMRDLGLESLGAQLSLLGRQVATTLNEILPAELNPFGYDEEELEEEEMRAAAKAAHDAEIEKETAAVAATARQLQSRRGPARGVKSPQQRLSSAEEEEEEDDDKLN